jgi:dihydroxy-acid dehydratase
MDARVIDKTKLPSRHVTEGPERAPHRSYYYAMGLTRQQIHQPFVGVATCWNEAAPCNIALMRQAQAVKKGVASAGGTPREFCTITVTDGIAMGHEGMKSSLPSREVIADSVELTVRGHSYDALVGLAGCDKSLPGMMMSMCRLNVPSIFIYGGSILPGTFRGRPVTVQDMFEAVGKHAVGDMSDEDLDEIEQVACPSAGACGGQFTANTMATVSEAIGLALPYSAGAPAPYELRDRFCTAAGEMIMDLVGRQLRPRDIVTRQALENAATVVAASGGSTNAALHLPAIAHECGIEFDLFDVAEIFKRTPYVADLKPGGRYVAKDLFEVGGIPLLMKTLLDGGFLHGDCVTVTGRTIAENLAKVAWNPDQDVVRPTDAPLTRTGGVVGLRGNLAPEGAIVKVAGMPADKQTFTGPARCFDSEEECFEAVNGRTYREGEVLVIRYEGPRGGPGNARDACHHRRPLRPGHGRQGGADHRRPLLRRDARLLHRPCRAGGGARRADRPPAGRGHRRDRRRRGPPRRAPHRRGACAAPRGVDAPRDLLRLWLPLEVRADRRAGQGRCRHPSGRRPRVQGVCGHLAPSSSHRRSG